MCERFIQLKVRIILYLKLTHHGHEYMGADHEQHAGQESGRPTLLLGVFLAQFMISVALTEEPFLISGHQDLSTLIIPSKHIKDTVSG